MTVGCFGESHKIQIKKLESNAHYPHNKKKLNYMPYLLYLIAYFKNICYTMHKVGICETPSKKFITVQI